MSLRTNADRMFSRWYDGGWYYRKDDSIRLLEDNTIVDYNTPIGKLVDDAYDELSDRYIQFVILTMQQFKGQKTWKSHKLQIAKSANKFGFPVIYVPQIDMGFGVNEVMTYNNLDGIYNDLLTLANQHKTDKVAVLIKYDGDLETLMYATEQDFGANEIASPVEVFKYNLSVNESNLTYISLIEPSANEINELVELGVSRIYFGIPLEKPLSYHIDIVNSILVKNTRDTNGLPIKYHRMRNIKVNKWYERRNAK